MGAEQHEPGRRTGAEHAVHVLRDGIVAGRFAPGQRLVEADLTRELGVGRNSLREAFSRLRSEGLVVVEPHRGASVRRLTRAEINDLYEISELLEGLAARRAAERIERPGNQERLETIHHTLRDAAAWESDPQSHRDDVEAYISVNHRFHMLVIDLADDAQLSAILDRLHMQTFSFQIRQASLAGFSQERLENVGEHLDLAQAIADGEGINAEHLMREHVRCVRDRFFALTVRR